ncbi:hypothetical protein D0469_13030 [Peribacillus saganii]|uniref:UPF0738 protein D0469_13030 n=1 Tax=Peribacillus saganii TaxID=2303992 RepID=A0A372LMX8_9BACI|nr:hypothetical protein [Peribacillus saganii]RFU68012.1 hypothetical protein D0469_13030 [Peribacillus saganii]
MKQKVTIAKAEWRGSELALVPGNETDLSVLKPKGQLLVDSDGLSFIYITEDDEDYIYISLPEAIWPELNVALRENSSVVAVSGGTQLELIGIHSELEYLIENIKGNGNYGEELVKRVEEIFFAESEF